MSRTTSFHGRVAVAPVTESKRRLPAMVRLALLLATASLAPACGAGDAAPKFATSAWSTRTLDDFSLDTPFELGPGPDVSSKLPPAVQAVMESIDVRAGGPEQFQVAVTCVSYKPQVEVSLDGAVAGAMKNGAAFIGDSAPDYTTLSASVDGLDARRATYRTMFRGLAFHIDDLVVSRGQKLWQVQTIYFSDAAAPDAKRILDSVHVLAAK